MKPYNYLLLPILTISLLTSCSKEENIDSPVSLTLRVAGVSLTRAAIDDASDLTSVGIYAANAETTEQTYGVRPAGIYGQYNLEQRMASPRSNRKICRPTRPSG